jgi:hypothetical protein
MRYVSLALALGVTLGLASCDPRWQNLHNPTPTPTAPRPGDTPSAAALVSYLNENARRVQSVDCRDLDLDAKQKLQSIGLSGWMVCQKPRNFRMGANVTGKQVVDMGSNDREFWFWISQAEPPYVYHCAYDDFARGQARLPFPIQPEWIMEAMGIAECSSPEHFTVAVRGNTLELVEQATSPQGKPVRKVTVFNRVAAQGNAPQVVARILQDANGKEICSATIKEVQIDRATGAILPKKIRLVFPEEKMELSMKLDGLTVNGQIEPQRTARLFTRPTMANVPSYDLARGPDAGAGQVRQTRGLMR